MRILQMDMVTDSFLGFEKLELRRVVFELENLDVGFDVEED